MTSEVDKSFPSSCDHLLSSKSVLSFEFFKFTVTDRLRVRSEKSTQDTTWHFSANQKSFWDRVLSVEEAYFSL